MSKKDTRRFVKLDVGFYAARKLKGAPPATKWLDVTGMCWAGQNLSDGEVDPAMMCALAGVPIKHASDLIKRGRWHEYGHDCPDCQQPEHESDVVIHHYLMHQSSATKVKKVAEKRSLAGRKANHTRHGHDGEFEECWQC